MNVLLRHNKFKGQTCSLYIFLVHIEISIYLLMKKLSMDILCHLVLVTNNEKYIVHLFYLSITLHNEYRSQWIERSDPSEGLYYTTHFTHFIPPIWVSRVVVNKFPLLSANTKNKPVTSQGSLWGVASLELHSSLSE